MTIGLAALAGIPPFAGFWSKDSILTAAEQSARDGHWTGWLVLVTGLATVAVTGAYVVRLWLRTFFGSARLGPAVTPHDPPPSMRWPLIGLAVPSALLGFAALWSTGPRSEVPGPDLAPGPVTAVLGVALALLGAGAAWLVWRRAPAADPARVLGRARPVLVNAFYLDAVQDFLVVRPVLALARLARRADERVVDGAVEGAGSGAVGAGRLLALAHAAGLGRYATAVLGGAALLVAAAALTGVRW
jgi:NADH-quinone oxidoreductase subunit L